MVCSPTRIPPGCQFIFVDVDCGAHADLCEDYDVSSYPQMKVLDASNDYEVVCLPPR